MKGTSIARFATTWAFLIWKCAATKPRNYVVIIDIASWLLVTIELGPKVWSGSFPTSGWMIIALFFRRRVHVMFKDVLEDQKSFCNVSASWLCSMFLHRQTPLIRYFWKQQHEYFKNSNIYLKWRFLTKLFLLYSLFVTPTSWSWWRNVSWAQGRSYSRSCIVWVRNLTFDYHFHFF